MALLTESFACSAISQVKRLHSDTAKGRLLNIRSSKKTVWAFSSLSGIIFSQNLISIFLRGRRIIVLKVLNIVWITATPTIAISAFKMLMPNAFIIYIITIQSKEPKTFTEKCITTTRFAFLFVPTAESSAVTQVPILAPSTRGIAISQVIPPAKAKA